MPKINEGHIFLGLDPGKSGGIAAVSEDGRALSFISSGSSTEHDVVHWLKDNRYLSADRSKAVLELVRSSPQMGVVSAFTFGRSYGFLRGILVGVGIAFDEVTPLKWQRAMKCQSGGNKNITKAAAQRIWPRERFTHANADAFLLAEFARRIYFDRKGLKIIS